MENRSKNIINRNALAFLVLSFTLTACGGDHAQRLAETSSGGTSGNRAGGADAAAVPSVITPDPPTMPPCTSPYAPVLEAMPINAILPIFANQGDGLEVAVEPSDADAASAWSVTRSVQFPSMVTDLGIRARLTRLDCTSAIEFSQAYLVRERFAPAAGLPESTAIIRTDARLQHWATRVIDYAPGSNVDVDWTRPERALGPAADDPLEVTSLGEGGVITLGFDTALRDGPGYDFAVFENGFGDDYLELAFVEISSDGVHFVRFDAASIVTDPVAAYGTMDPTEIEGFAGKYRVGWGTPFDLAWLRARPEVRAGLVDLSNITAVRVIDVVGDGRVRDSLGHVVYDPYPTSGGAGFDLDAVGLINVAP
jgi:hypothetical protein